MSPSWTAPSGATVTRSPGVSSTGFGTGGRIVTTLANEMARRNARYGLDSICAAGAMAGAFLLERS